MSAPDERRGFRGKALFFALALVGLAADLASKAVVIESVRERSSASPASGGRVPVVEGFFYLADVENRGGVFGIGQGYSAPLAAARAIALVVILAFVRATPRRERLHLACLAFLFAGAAGNLYDNLTNDGAVRDWLDFYLLGDDRAHFPTFNLADAQICVGAFLLLGQGLFARRQPARDAPAT